MELYDLYIQVDENGDCVEHPILRENLEYVYPELDLSQPHDKYKPFIRVQKPSDQPYKKDFHVTYENVDGIFMDVWHSTDLTLEEKKAKQDAVHRSWAKVGFPSWVFDEEKCIYAPPIPEPKEGGPYDWDEDTGNWRKLECQT